MLFLLLMFCTQLVAMETSLLDQKYKNIKKVREIFTTIAHELKEQNSITKYELAEAKDQYFYHFQPQYAMCLRVVEPAPSISTYILETRCGSFEISRIYGNGSAFLDKLHLKLTLDPISHNNKSTCYIIKAIEQATIAYVAEEEKKISEMTGEKLRIEWYRLQDAYNQ